jgi:hypothetical protein
MRSYYSVRHGLRASIWRFFAYRRRSPFAAALAAVCFLLVLFFWSLARFRLAPADVFGGADLQLAGWILKLTGSMFVEVAALLGFAVELVSFRLLRRWGRR